jgi:hypothetical protein
MAIAFAQALNGTGFKATATSLTSGAVGFNCEVGNLIIVGIGLDDTAGDVAGSIVTSVTDSVGNTYQRARESTTGGAAAGASVSVWFCNVRTQLSNLGTITANFSSRGAGGMYMAEFTMAANSQATLLGTNADTGSASAMLSTSLNVVTANEAALRIRFGAGEEESITTGTKTAAFTALFATGTANSGTGGAAITNIITRGEYLVSTAAGEASQPTSMPSCDWASVYIALREEPNMPSRTIPDTMFNRTAMVPC